ncbi:MAG TPA: TonB-dependent receptor [Terracidiphilus sp.]|nr:TonB-dependent receptor [Terracidiphilus sp.]
MGRVRQLLCALSALVFPAFAAASPYHGVVTFGGLPLPGATITASQGTKTLTTISDQSGAFAFDDLADGTWTIRIAMQCFEPVRAEVIIAPKTPAAKWELKLLPQSQIMAHAQTEMPAVELPPSVSAAQEQKPAQDSPQNTAQSAPEMPKAPQQENEQSADGLLVQGSVNNAATSIYSTNPAFGNTRSGSRGLYTGGLAAIEESSALDARPYSLSGIRAPKPAFNNFTGVAALQGPIRIPHLLPRGPNFFLTYQWTRNSSSQILTGLVPTQAEQSGNLAGLTNALGQPVTVYNPATGAAFANNQVPVSPQAAALLKLYPLPNIANVAGYNYQAPVVSDTHRDALQSRLDKTVGRKDQLYGGFAFQSTRADNVNLFGFDDHTGTLGINSNIHWSHRIKPSLFLFAGYTFSRLRTEVRPNFERRVNVSGNAGISGNDQDPADWGPPALSFSSGFAPLTDANSAFNRNRSDDVTASVLIYRGKHDFTFGGEFRKQEYNELFQQNPRGTFTFTGAATQGPGGPASGSDLADFLVGIPDASNIAYGNADKYFREPVYAVYGNDEWRVLPIFTINAGLRWDYGAPMTELFGRLVNLDVAEGFTAVAPVVGSNPVGPITGEHYPSSLIQPDRTMIQPRIGVSWRPIPASTVVIRAGYGIYPDTSVYQNLILQMAQQAPLSISQSVQNSSACALTLADGFAPCASITSQTFGIDPNFRVGYAQQWNLQIQRDLPFAMQMVASYYGTKGTHGPQEILPNSYPLGEANPCPGCPSGFVYETSSGNSIRHAGQLQLRRRLRSGLAASLAYTYAKSIDDDAYLGGQGHTSAGGGQTQSANLSLPAASISQNWLDPRAERSLSTFDQRHLLNLQAQYTSGQGLEGGTLLGGWAGRMLKEWTVLGTLSFGSGLPETPLYPAAVPGTGFTNIIRPRLTGAPIYTSQASKHLNIAAFSAPAPGQWGSAGRDSLTGPNQFSFNSSLARTFRPLGKAYLDFAIVSTNSFNHAAFSSWNNYVTSTQFGQPVAPNVMRSLEITTHLRFK